MSAITVAIDAPGWRRHRGLKARLIEAAEAARRAAKIPARAGITILLTGDGALKRLNRAFRGKDKPTNVLSFPADMPDYRGDIAIAYGVTAAEAKAAGKRFSDHAAHLVVHGVLHLAGYDHIRAGDAKVMEPLEVKILARLGIADPYRTAP
jgi:probable rRNA maturation factor